MGNRQFANRRIHSYPYRSQARRGTTLVELALVLPVFLVFMFGLLEFGHVLMVANTLTSVAKQAAHQGSFGDSSSQDVIDFALVKMQAVAPESAVTVSILDGSAFETSSSTDFSGLSSLELDDLESRQLFVVHVSVPYNAVALLPPFWTSDVVLEGTSIMRRE